MGWTKGGEERYVVSLGTSNPAELGAADRDNKDPSSLGPTVDGSGLGVLSRVSATPTGEEQPQLEPNQSSPSLPMLSPHATAKSSGDEGPAQSGTVESEVETATASQITKHKGHVPEEEVPTEHMTAQGTGAKAVRSLSKMVGGERGEESGDTGIESPTTISKSGGALTGTYVANSCGKFPNRR